MRFLLVRSCFMSNLYRIFRVRSSFDHKRAKDPVLWFVFASMVPIGQQERSEMAFPSV